MRKEDSPFSLGRYWLGQVPGSERWYRFWYDAGTGEIRRRTLKTGDFEAAKVALAAVVLKEGSGTSEAPANVTIFSVLSRYWEQHTDGRPCQHDARWAGGYVLDFLGNSAKVSEFIRAKQKAFIRHLDGKGLAIGSISNIMLFTKAAFNKATMESDDEDAPEPLLLHAPKVISGPKTVAKILDKPDPVPRNWSPTLEMVAEFLNGLEPEEEHLRRFILLKVAFACRSQAALDVGPFLLDHRDRLLALNPPNRRQTIKYRPTLPVPDVLWPVLTSKEWSSASHFVNRDGNTISMALMSYTWRTARARLGLPVQLIPHSLRHFMATELRHAHRRHGVERVPDDERERWLGHRKSGIHERYGDYEPDYLLAAKTAVQVVLMKLDRRLHRPFFRQNAAKSRRTREDQKAFKVLIGKPKSE